MPQGGTITIRAENQVIDNKSEDSALVQNEGKYVRISIQDEGRGIPKEDLDRIFDPYFSTKTRGVQKGMGLGMATAYAIVRRHGGHIVVSSIIGVGTTVFIYLPVDDEKGEWRKAEQQECKSETPSSGKARTIARRFWSWTMRKACETCPERCWNGLDMRLRPRKMEMRPSRYIKDVWIQEIHSTRLSWISPSRAE